jgi:pyruvate/2-oxoglutarate dehydrogenase complex dihydrolipoamide dehydrogenase (E3) component
MSEIEANRLGMHAEVRTGFLQAVEGDDASGLASCRIIADTYSGRVVGATVYGPDAHRWIEPIRKAIEEQACRETVTNFREVDPAGV